MSRIKSLLDDEELGSKFKDVMKILEERGWEPRDVPLEPSLMDFKEKD